MEYVIKAYLEGADCAVEVRRIPVSLASQDSNNGIYNETVARVRSTFPGLVDKIFALKWKDSDGDLVMMSSDEELMEAVSQCQNVPLKVYIAVEGVKETESDKAEQTQAHGNQEPKSSESKASNHKKDDPFGAGWPFMGPMGMPFPPPSDCQFGDPMKFYSTSGRGRPDFNNPRGNFGFQFGQQNPRGHNFDNLGSRGQHFGPMGPQGQHFGPMGSQGQHFGPMGSQGQHFGPMGPFSGPFGSQGPHFDQRGGHAHHFGPPGYTSLRGGHHFGHFMGMHGPFESHHFFEEQQPCSFACHEEKHNEDGSWKAKLREAVPVAHRRWAKIYIRNWRVHNLKNATSTSSDSEQETFTMEAASVPGAYAAWLDAFLLKWHKRLAKLDADSQDTGTDSDEKKKLKASVPLEFRKWAKWYLTRHFGKKEAPKFRKEVPGEEKMENLHKKGWKKAVKMHTLSVFVPLEHRVWAQKFIHDWRQEHNILEPETRADDVLLECDATDKETGQGNVTVPEDYAKWMRKFLARWHLCRGQIDGQKVQVVSGQKGEFKDSVPKSFRKWVKCFLWQTYGKGAGKDEANTLSKYQQWLQAFQQKWLAEQSKDGNIDELVLTSSDEETAAGPLSDATGHMMENAFKKLRVDDNQSEAKKNVQFGNSDKASTAMYDSDNSDIEMNPMFQHWDASWKCEDGSTPTSADGEQIPAHLLMKMQMKRMKEEFKQAKHSLKAAMKKQKYGHL